MTDASFDRTAEFLDYHEATKHSPESIRRRGHLLDWANKPHPFKVYAGLQRVPLPEEIPSLRVPALETIDATAVGDPGPGPDLASPARLLVRGARVHHVVTFPAADVIHFRNYASAGALYPVEVYLRAPTCRASPPACTTSIRAAQRSPASARATTASERRRGLIQRIGPAACSCRRCGPAGVSAPQ